MLISIIIPIYNGQEFIERCVKSCSLQESVNIEIICIDDGSTDNSGNIISNLIACDQRIRYFYKQNGGLVSARKFGLRMAVGDFVFFIDSDDYLEPRCLYELSKWTNNYNYIVGTMIIEKSDGTVIKKRQNYKCEFNSNTTDITSIFLKECIVPSLCGRLIEKKLFDKYNETILNSMTIGEDAIANIYLSQTSYMNVMVMPIDTYHYVQYKTSMANKRNYDKVILFIEQLEIVLHNYNKKELLNSYIVEQVYSVIRDFGFNIKIKSQVDSLLLKYNKYSLSWYKKIIIVLYLKNSIFLKPVLHILNYFRKLKNYSS